MFILIPRIPVLILALFAERCCFRVTRSTNLAVGGRRFPMFWSTVKSGYLKIPPVVRKTRKFVMFSEHVNIITEKFLDVWKIWKVMNSECSAVCVVPFVLMK